MSLPRYPEYKASGVAWLGEVPGHWQVKQLKYSADVRLSNIDKHTVENEPPVLLCNYVDVYKNERINSGIEFMPATASPEQIRRLTLEVGDVIITKDSEDPSDIGVPALVSEVIPNLVCGYHLALLRPRANRISGYIYYLFKSRYVAAAFETEATGITRYALGKYSIENLSIPLPSVEEKTTIAAFLDHEIEKIDALIVEQQRLVELLNEEIISLVLSSFRAPETSELRLIEVSTIISRPVIQKADESYTRIGLFNRGRGLFHKDASEMDEMGESDFFWVEEGDLIISGQFAWEGAVALADIEDTGCVVSHRYPVIRGKAGVVLTEYLLGLLCTKHGDFLLNENSRGAAGRNRPLNISSLMKEKIPVPSMEIQKKVARAVHTRKALFKEIAKAIALLQERRSALISAAVTGKIDVRGM